MFDFVAFAWNAEDALAGDTAVRLSAHYQALGVEWGCALSTSNLLVFARFGRSRSFREYRLPDKSGLILGRLFPMNMRSWHNNWEAHFDADAAGAFVQTRGRRLAESYWGSYIAFFRTADGSQSFVLRDCSGKTQCYRTKHEGVDIFFSDINTLPLRDLPAFTLNLQYLAAFIYSPEMETRECGLREVTELLAGDGFDVRSGQHYVAWDPRQICREQPLEDYTSAVDQLRTVTQGCIDAWASVYDNILHSLSGGFDSAVVLGALRRSKGGPRVTAMNAFGAYSGGDERIYARAAASDACVKLIERPMDLSDHVFDARLINLPWSTKPSVLRAHSTFEIEALNAIARDTGAEAIWTGEGGDHLFYAIRTWLGFVDCFRMNGICSRSAGALHDSANISGKSYYSIIKAAHKYLWHGASWTLGSRRIPARCFVREEALPSDPTKYSRHPWLGDSELTPGKQEHIYAIFEVLNRHRPYTQLRYANHHHVLLAQPLIELSLRIPTYHLLKGGVTRGLAREAFAEYIPTSIRQRNDKGVIGSTITDRFRRSEQFLREVLIDGVLSSQHVLDRRELETVIANRQPIRRQQLRPLLACVAAEIWARQCPAA